MQQDSANPPEGPDQMELTALRDQIDAIDSDIVDKLNRRARLAMQIGELKAATSSNIFDPGRERKIVEKILALNPGPLPPESLQSIYREIISSMRALEKPLTVAYWGPPATNTHLASVKKFGSSTSFVPQDSIADVFDVVQKQQADFGVVPIENSIEGIVNHALDMFLRSDLKICAEVYLPISHCFLSMAGSLGEVKRIYSNPVALAQCRHWLGMNMKGIEIVDCSTTARAAVLASEDPTSAAVAGELAAEIYGLNTLASHIEDNVANRTRFLVVGYLEPRPSGKDKTSVVFSVPHRAGSLVEALLVFQRAGLNLTLIESRPTKTLPWEYVFYVDCQVHQEDDRMKLALGKLEEITTFTRVLGSYPEAD